MAFEFYDRPICSIRVYIELFERTAIRGRAADTGVQRGYRGRARRGGLGFGPTYEYRMYLYKYTSTYCEGRIL